MSTIVTEKENGELFCNTTVQIPLMLRKEARKKGISISRIATEALRQALEGGSNDLA